jgi:hypothetical protein
MKIAKQKTAQPHVITLDGRLLLEGLPVRFARKPATSAFYQNR